MKKQTVTILVITGGLLASGLIVWRIFGGSDTNTDREEELMRRLNEAEKTKPAGLTRENFDYDFYLKKYPDVKEATAKAGTWDAYDHYIIHGKSEGREYKTKW